MGMRSKSKEKKSLLISKITEEAKEEEKGPTVEERRKTVIEKYYSTVRMNGHALLSKKALLAMQGPRRLRQESSSDEQQHLPTISEAHEVSSYDKTIDSNGNDDALSQYTVPSPDVQEIRHSSKDQTSYSLEEARSREQATPKQLSAIQATAEPTKKHTSPRELKVESLEHRDITTPTVVLENDLSKMELSIKDIEAMFEAATIGDIETLDDLLDLPGADINITWYGENLLMAAMRNGQEECAFYLIDNGININYAKTRYELREVIKEEQLPENSESPLEFEGKAKKKKKKKKDQDLYDSDVIQYGQFTTRKEDKQFNLDDVDCFYVTCREMAFECGMHNLVDWIDHINGTLWPSIKLPERQVRNKKVMIDKLKEQGVWVESEEEPEPEPEEKPDLKTSRLRSRLTSHSKHDLNTSNRASRAGSRYTSMENLNFPKIENDRGVASQISFSLQTATIFKQEQGKESFSHDQFKYDNLVHEEQDPLLIQNPKPTTPEPHMVYPKDVHKTKYSYQCSKSFLSRVSASLRRRQTQEMEVHERSEPQYTTHGPKVHDKTHILKDTDKKSHSATENGVKERLKKSTSRTKDEQEVVRFVSPWKHDNYQSLVNLFYRSKTMGNIQSAKSDKPMLRNWKSDALLQTGSRPPSEEGTLMPVLRTDSTLYAWSSGKSSRDSSRRTEREDSASQTLTNSARPTHSQMSAKQTGSASTIRSSASNKSLSQLRYDPKKFGTKCSKQMAMSVPSYEDIYGQSSQWYRTQTDSMRFALQGYNRIARNRTVGQGHQKTVRYSMEVEVLQ